MIIRSYMEEISNSFFIHSSRVLNFLGKRFRLCTCLIHLWNF